MRAALESTGDVDLVGPGRGAPGDVGPLGRTAGRGGGIDRAQVAGEPLKRDALGIGQFAVVGREGDPFVEIDLGPVDLLQRGEAQPRAVRVFGVAEGKPELGADLLLQDARDRAGVAAVGAPALDAAGEAVGGAVGAQAGALLELALDRELKLRLPLTRVRRAVGCAPLPVSPLTSTSVSLVPLQYRRDYPNMSNARRAGHLDRRRGNT